MDPLTIGLITGGASLLGSMFSSETSAQNTQSQIAAQAGMQQQSEQFNAQQADINRQFQASQITGQQQFEQQMSNTAYQRASSDMKAAGLNPMMMFGSGGPSSTPSVGSASGSTASVGTPNVPMPQTTNPLAGLGDAVRAGVSNMVNAKTVDKMSEEIANMKVLENRGVAEAATEAQRARLVGTQADIAGYQATSAQAQAEKDRRYIDMPSWYKNAVEYSRYGASGVSSVGDAISSFSPTAQAVRRFMPETSTREGSRSYASDGSFDEFYKTRTGF